MEGSACSEDCQLKVQSSLEHVRTSSQENHGCCHMSGRAVFVSCSCARVGVGNHRCWCALPVELSWLHLCGHRKERWGAGVQPRPPQRMSPTEHQGDSWEVWTLPAVTIAVALCPRDWCPILVYKLVSWALHVCARGAGGTTFGEGECHANFVVIGSFLLLCGKGNTWCMRCLISGVALVLTYGVTRLQHWKQRSSYQSQKWCSVQFMLGKCGIFQKDRIPCRRGLCF